MESNDADIKGYAFVPFFELFNQYLTPDAFHPEGDYPIKFQNGEFLLLAQRDFNIGEETYVPYRRKSNYKLFEDFGITIPNNRHSFIQISVEENSSLCKITDKGCTFYFFPTEINEKYLEFLKKTENPLMSYRKGIKTEILRFKFALRHQRRRVKILEDRILKAIFNFSISEKWTAYKALALIDRKILKGFINSLKLD